MASLCCRFHLSVPNWLPQEDLEDIINDSAIEEIKYLTECETIIHDSTGTIRLESNNESAKAATNEILRVLSNYMKDDNEKENFLRDVSVCDEDGQILQIPFGKSWEQIKKPNHERNNRKDALSFTRSFHLPNWLTKIYDLKHSIEHVIPWAQMQFNCEISVTKARESSNIISVKINSDSKNWIEVGEKAMQNLVLTRIEKQYWGCLLYNFSMQTSRLENGFEEIMTLQQRNPDELNQYTYGVLIPLNTNDVSCEVSRKYLQTLLQPVFKSFPCKVDIVGSDEISEPFIFVHSENSEALRKHCKGVISYLRKSGFQLPHLASGEMLMHDEKIKSNNTSFCQSNSTSLHEDSIYRKRKHADDNFHYQDSKASRYGDKVVPGYNEHIRDSFNYHERYHETASFPEDKFSIGRRKPTSERFQSRQTNDYQEYSTRKQHFNRGPQHSHHTPSEYHPSYASRERYDERYSNNFNNSRTTTDPNKHANYLSNYSGSDPSFLADNQRAEGYSENRYTHQNTFATSSDYTADSYRHQHQHHQQHLYRGGEMSSGQRIEISDNFRYRNHRPQREEENSRATSVYQSSTFQQRHPNFASRDKTFL